MNSKTNRQQTATREELNRFFYGLLWHANNSTIYDISEYLNVAAELYGAETVKNVLRRSGWAEFCAFVK